ncbi:hypothetical protein pYptb0025 (plasmid) [Yersinia pseudotuberculosis IP 32953]|uniref:Uncharacterized protein n=1 Tax=Yersinia pseudotuberculosis serotype I (strain IP32953) TaxID=273123 RepID=Q663C9_YERPS|nr:hypothetical protein pYptb0025 [Yersinia pseudotuberculosis IP 32953]
MTTFVMSSDFRHFRRREKIEVKITSLGGWSSVARTNCPFF